MSDIAMKNSSLNALAVRDPWALVPSLGNLDAYIGAVNRVPMLTQEEETEFARRLRDTRRPRSRRRAWCCRTCAWWSRSRASTSATACRTAT